MGRHWPQPQKQQLSQPTRARRRNGALRSVERAAKAYGIHEGQLAGRELRLATLSVRVETLLNGIAQQLIPVPLKMMVEEDGVHKLLQRRLHMLPKWLREGVLKKTLVLAPLSPRGRSARAQGGQRSTTF